MFTAIRVIRVSTANASTTPMKLSIGDQPETSERALPKTIKPISTIADGLNESEKPVSREAVPPSFFSESIMDDANAGPFMSSHQKKPVMMVKRTNSAKKSPMSALRSAIIPNVQTMEIVARVQNKRVAAA
ncbi:hypothetical protein D3C85_936760 [compost metagenome]